MVTKLWCHTKFIVSQSCHTDSGVTLSVWLQSSGVTLSVWLQSSGVTLSVWLQWCHTECMVTEQWCHTECMVTVVSHWVYGYRAVVSHWVHSQHTKATRDTHSRVLKSVHIIPGLSFPVLLASMNVVINFCTVSSSQLDLNSRWTWGNTHTHTHVSLCGEKKGHAIFCFKERKTYGKTPVKGTGAMTSHGKFGRCIPHHQYPFNMLPACPDYSFLQRLYALLQKVSSANTSIHKINTLLQHPPPPHPIQKYKHKNNLSTNLTSLFNSTPPPLLHPPPPQSKWNRQACTWPRSTCWFSQALT